MPAQFGSDSTWIKGTLNKVGDEVTYFNLYAISGIHLENNDDYVIHLPGGKIVLLYNCTQVDDLAAIAPPADS